MKLKKSKVDGLIKRDIWEVVNKSDIPLDATIVGGRFELTLKNYGTPTEKAKGRFNAQGFSDKDKSIVIHDTATLRAASIRLILSAASFHRFRLFSHDVTQAYLQSKYLLTRKIFIRIKDADLETFGLEKGQALYLKKPLYGICDAGNYRGITIEEHLINDIGMVPIIGDRVLYVKRQGSKIIGPCGSYVEDLLNVSTLEFQKLAEQTLEQFESKP